MEKVFKYGWYIDDSQIFEHSLPSLREIKKHLPRSGPPAIIADTTVCAIWAFDEEA